MKKGEIKKKDIASSSDFSFVCCKLLLFLLH